MARSSAANVAGKSSGHDPTQLFIEQTPTRTSDVAHQTALSPPGEFWNPDSSLGRNARLPRIATRRNLGRMSRSRVFSLQVVHAGVHNFGYPGLRSAARSPMKWANRIIRMPTIEKGVTKASL